MKKNKYLKTATVLLPPLLLVLVGIVIYSLVNKLLEPDIKTISITPNQNIATESAEPTSNQSTHSAQNINPISTEISKPSQSELKLIQSEVDEGKNEWRKDPLATAEQVAGIYGFIPGDQLNLITNQDSENIEEGKATILALHSDQAYILTMIQPLEIGSNGIWILDSIEKQ